MSRLFLWMMLLLSPWPSNSQHYNLAAFEKKAIASQNRFSKKYVYLVCRGSRDKAPLISQFNLMDSNSSHIGIGIARKGRLEVFHVFPGRTRTGSALRRETLFHFIKDDAVYSVAIWKSGIKKSGRKKLQAFLTFQQSRSIVFDDSFSIHNNDTLYCSEFCSQALAYIGPAKFLFTPTTRTHPLLEIISGKKEHLYFPVDFFRQSPSFRLECSYQFTVKTVQ